MYAAEVSYQCHGWRWVQISLASLQLRADPGFLFLNRRLTEVRDANPQRSGIPRSWSAFRHVGLASVRFWQLWWYMRASPLDPPPLRPACNQTSHRCAIATERSWTDTARPADIGVDTTVHGTRCGLSHYSDSVSALLDSFTALGVRLMCRIYPVPGSS